MTNLNYSHAKDNTSVNSGSITLPLMMDMGRFKTGIGDLMVVWHNYFFTHHKGHMTNDYQVSRWILWLVHTIYHLALSLLLTLKSTQLNHKLLLFIELNRNLINRVDDCNFPSIGRQKLNRNQRNNHHRDEQQNRISPRRTRVYPTKINTCHINDHTL